MENKHDIDVFFSVFCTIITHVVGNVVIICICLLLLLSVVAIFGRVFPFKSPS